LSPHEFTYSLTFPLPLYNTEIFKKVDKKTFISLSLSSLGADIIFGKE
jgi:hypothetical protein